jgi:hypothetical protein
MGFRFEAWGLVG